PDLTGELSMTTAKQLARYSAVEGALASGFATAELHHLWGRDPMTGSSGRHLRWKPGINQPTDGHVRVYPVVTSHAHPLST
ncbi:hypothetical protein O7A61_21530, partial [Mesorhizobium sp. Cs1321R2N1]